MPTKKQNQKRDQRGLQPPKEPELVPNDVALERRKTKKLGRPQRSQGTIPTQYQLTMLEKVLAGGNHFQTACKAAGIPWKVFEGWKDMGYRGDPLYQPLLEAIDRGESAAEMLALAIVVECAQGSTIEREMNVKGGKNNSRGWHESETTKQKDWRAAAWILEHRFSERFAKLRRLQHSGGLTHRQVIIVHNEDPSLEFTEWEEKKDGDPELEAADPQADADAEGGEPRVPE